MHQQQHAVDAPTDADVADALQRARTHLAKEKANLEGERNALNKVVKEAQRSADQCLKDLKKKKGGH